MRTFLSTVFKLEIFPSDIYFLEELPSEVNLYSIVIILISSRLVSAIASYIPARQIAKMKTLWDSVQARTTEEAKVVILP